MDKVLITGGTGFLGSHLIRSLNKEYSVTSVSRKKKNQKRIPKVKYLFFDIAKYSLAKKYLEKKNFDFIINCCGNINHNKKTETYNAHLKVVKNLIKTLKKKKIKKFIQIGSCLEYGSIKSPQRENEICKPNSNYGNAKYFATKLIKKNFPQNYLILRPYQIFGPLQKLDRLIPITINSCLNDKSFACTNGSQLRDFLYITDFVKLIKIILKKHHQINYGIFNVGSGKPYKVSIIINKIKNKIKKGTPQFGKIKMRKDEIIKLYPSIKKIKKQFQWYPETNIDKALNKTIQYYKKLHLYLK